VDVALFPSLGHHDHEKLSSAGALNMVHQIDIDSEDLLVSEVWNRDRNSVLKDAGVNEVHTPQYACKLSSMLLRGT
jgi:hypothetical protein